MNKPALDIIKSPSAERMRQMATEGFYDRSRVALWMFEVIGREWDEMGDWAWDLRNEIFPQTCTWSLPIWEWVYGFEPDDTLSLEFRRQRILSKRLERPPINPARIEAALAALTGGTVNITDFVKPYTFRVDVGETGETIYDYREALKTLRKMKPSHLSFNYESYTEPEVDIGVYFATAPAYVLKQYIVCDQPELPTDQTDYSAAAPAMVLKEYIITDNPTIPDTTTDYGATATNQIIKEVYKE